MALNSSYYLVCVGMSLSVSAYTFNLLLAHVYEERWHKLTQMALTAMGVIYTILILGNVWNGWIFWFDFAGGYHRGILNASGYFIMFIEIAMICCCYHVHRESVDSNVKRVIYTLAPITVAMIIFQRLSPNILFNGTMAMLVLLVYFVNFQNSQAERDGLTGVGNSKSFYEELNTRLTDRERFQVMVVSLKGFSLVNHRYGHRKGDEILYHMCNWLEKCRKGGRAFRFGNVTFALVCPYTDEEDTRALIAQIENRFDSPWVLGETRVTIPTCYVSMVCDRLQMEATQMLEVLSFMVELAKTREDGRVAYDAETRQLFQSEKEMEQLMQDSISKERFEVWYQPVYNCISHEFDSAEALVRLRDYEGNIISPNDFIPLAEKNGMIEDIGWLVWKQVCRFISTHPEMTLSISVNMSAQQFTNPKLCERMEKYLELCEIPPDRIKLEITERVIMQDEKYMNQVMHKLSSRGFRFCVDDFGVGYSNFSSVMNLPFEVIKLDRSLIERLPSDSVNQLAIRFMVEMFHNMGLSIVAEGVETRRQQEMIQQLGVDYIQGFYYARPMPEGETLAYLEKTEGKQQVQETCGKQII